MMRKETRIRTCIKIIHQIIIIDMTNRISIYDTIIYPKVGEYFVDCNLSLYGKEEYTPKMWSIRVYEDHRGVPCLSGEPLTSKQWYCIDSQLFYGPHVIKK